MQKLINRNLPVPLTTSEKVDFGRNLAVLHEEYRGRESAKKADGFKEDLERLDGRISYIAGVIRSGEEYRQVECQWRYLFDVNAKELIRMDTGEIVETAAITPEERQLMLQIDAEKETESAMSSKTKK